jgi:acetylornithine deacetylase/succinyl-diaminopimelate desuccinylase-like protein
VTPPALQQETTEVLSRLVRFNTVNPPGNERPLQEWLSAYLSDAGFECELLGADPERPNLVARLPGAAPGPVLGYLSHVDTVIAEPDDWRHDPWCGEVHDGFLWGRGALDMKSQTAAEAVAGAALARSGWRPPRGELRIMVVVDEETGGALGARWLTEQRPDAVRCDFVVNEGGGAVMPYGDRRFYGVCVGEKGTFRFTVKTTGVAGHASVPGLGDNALLKLAPLIERLGAAPIAHQMGRPQRAVLSALGQDPDDPGGAVTAIRAAEPRLAAMIEPLLGVTFAPTCVSASRQINVLPGHAEVQVDCRMPPGMEAETALTRAHEVLGRDGYDIEALERTVGNASPVDTPLMEAIRGWVSDNDPAGEAVPSMLPAFTDSHWYRVAFPDCVAYGFFPQRHQSLYEVWPLVHSANERIDVRDLGFAAAFFHDLPRRVLA